MTSSNGSIFRVTGPLCGEFTGHRWIPLTRPVTRSFDNFFDLCLNKRLSKQSWGWWFETPLRSLWRHCNAYITDIPYLTDKGELPNVFSGGIKLLNYVLSLQWRHNGRDSVSNHRRDDCVLNRSFSCSSKNTSKLRLTGLCAWNSPVTGEFPTQRASNAENVSYWWRHHILHLFYLVLHPVMSEFSPCRYETLTDFCQHGSTLITLIISVGGITHSSPLFLCSLGMDA